MIVFKRKQSLLAPVLLKAKVSHGICRNSTVFDIYEKVEYDRIRSTFD